MLDPPLGVRVDLDTGGYGDHDQPHSRCQVFCDVDKQRRAAQFVNLLLDCQWVEFCADKRGGAGAAVDHTDDDAASLGVGEADSRVGHDGHRLFDGAGVLLEIQGLRFQL